MNASEIIRDIEFTGLTRHVAQFVRADLIERIDAAIAAAVQDEREEILSIIDNYPTNTDEAYKTIYELAAAIRAQQSAS